MAEKKAQMDKDPVLQGHPKRWFSREILPSWIIQLWPDLSYVMVRLPLWKSDTEFPYIFDDVSCMSFLSRRLRGFQWHDEWHGRLGRPISGGSFAEPSPTIIPWEVWTDRSRDDLKWSEKHKTTWDTLDMIDHAVFPCFRSFDCS